jgi:hypothetical protein
MKLKTVFKVGVTNGITFLHPAADNRLSHTLPDVDYRSSEKLKYIFV